MRKTSAELRMQAKRALSGRYGTVCGGILLAVLFMFLAMIMMFGAIAVLGIMLSLFGHGFASQILLTIIVGFIIYLGMLAFMTGEIRICYRICAGEESELSDLFFGLTHRPLRFAAMWLIFYLGIGVIWGLMALLTNAGVSLRGLAGVRTDVISLLLMLAGNLLLMIIWSLLLMRHMINVIAMIENPERSIRECLGYGSELMRGNYGRLLRLWPGMIGMVVLGYITLGIGFLWIMPYQICVMILFYFDLKEERFPAAHETWNYEGQDECGVWG